MFWRGRYGSRRRISLDRATRLHPQRTTSQQNEDNAAGPGRRRSSRIPNNPTASQQTNDNDFDDATARCPHSISYWLPLNDHHAWDDNDPNVLPAVVLQPVRRVKSCGDQPSHSSASFFTAHSPNSSEDQRSWDVRTIYDDQISGSDKTLDDDLDSQLFNLLGNTDSDNSIYAKLPSFDSIVSSASLKPRQLHQSESAPAILSCAPLRVNTQTACSAADEMDSTYNWSSFSTGSSAYSATSSTSSTSIKSQDDEVVISSYLLPLGSHLCNEPPPVVPLALTLPATNSSTETGLQEEMHNCAMSTHNYRSFIQLLRKSSVFKRLTFEQGLEAFWLDYRKLVMQQQQLEQQRATH